MLSSITNSLDSEISCEMIHDVNGSMYFESPGQPQNVGNFAEVHEPPTPPKSPDRYPYGENDHEREEDGDVSRTQLSALIRDM